MPFHPPYQRYGTLFRLFLRIFYIFLQVDEIHIFMYAAGSRMPHRLRSYFSRNRVAAAHKTNK